MTGVGPEHPALWAGVPASTLYVGIDDAERYSAAVGLDAAGTVLLESVADFDAATRPPDPRRHLPLAETWARDLAGRILAVSMGELRETAYSRTVIAVEDLSHHMVNPKPAIRVQAVILNELYRNFDDVRLVTGSVWQSGLGYRKEPGRSTKGWAREMCAAYGYAPASAGKARIDLRDAYLIARWLHQVDVRSGTE